MIWTGDLRVEDETSIQKSGIRDLNLFAFNRPIHNSVLFWTAVIFDDLFALSLSLIRPVCSILKQYDLMYRCNIQARYFTKWGDEMARMLADSGCYEVAFGAESGSQKILDNVRKRCTTEQNFQTVEYAKRFGIKVKAFILLGLPGEDHQTLRETEAFVRNSGCDDYQFAVYMPFRGTAIRDAIEGGEAKMDLAIVPGGPDGEVTGAYGVNGGETAYEVRTAALSEAELHQFRDYLVTTYRPASHQARWLEGQDHFFELAFTSASERRSGQTLVPVLPSSNITQPFAPTTTGKNVDCSAASCLEYHDET
ncbi:MAG: B12-binding domain-containing radical SAM protein [Terriglobia bacterium]